MAWLGGTAQLVLTAALAGAASSLLGLGLPEAMAVGAAISVSSTAVVMRVLVDRAELESRHGRTALGILLLQDLAVIPLGLAIIAAGKGRGGAEALGELLRNVGLALLFILVSYVVVRYILPGMFQRARLSGTATSRWFLLSSLRSARPGCHTPSAYRRSSAPLSGDSYSRNLPLRFRFEPTLDPCEPFL